MDQWGTDAAGGWCWGVFLGQNSIPTFGNYRFDFIGTRAGEKVSQNNRNRVVKVRITLNWTYDEKVFWENQYCSFQYDWICLEYFTRSMGHTTHQVSMHSMATQTESIRIISATESYLYDWLRRVNHPVSAVLDIWDVHIKDDQYTWAAFSVTT